MHVGKLSGGTALNIVPDRAEMTFEFRHLAADEPDDLFARIEAAAAEVAGRHRGARIELTVVNAYPGLNVAPDNAVAALAGQLAASDRTTKVAFGTEAGIFAELGIPTVVCGPGSMAGQGHKADEYLAEAQLAECDAMMSRVLDVLRGEGAR